MSLEATNARRYLFTVVATFIIATPVFGQSMSEINQPTVASLSRSAGIVLPHEIHTQAEQGITRRLSMNDAVEMALEQNLTIQVERLNPQLQDLAIATVRAAWTPTLSTTFQNNDTQRPSSTQLDGGAVSTHTSAFSNDIGISQLTKWGGNYNVSWNSSTQSTSNFFTSFNPSVRSTVNFNYSQPLLRNFKIDNARQQLLISTKDREISDVQLRETIVSTVRQVKNAYWQLSYAIASLAVQQQSLELAEESLRNNQVRVEVGTMAPIDIVEAQAEVARNEETVIVAESAIDEAEDGLRALIMDPVTPNFWDINLEPTDTPLLQTREIDIDAAVRNALSKRTDLSRIRKNLENVDVNIRYYKNQTLPDVNFQVNYSAQGVGGTKLTRDSFFGGNVTNRVTKGYGSVLGDVFTSDFPTWTFGFTVGYPIGTSTADVNLVRSRLQRRQAETQIKSTELQVAGEVRRVGREVNTNLKRVDATESARQLAEQRLDAEQKKFAVGMSTSFLVFQAQRDLAQARNNELGAILDYNQAIVDFDAVQESSLTGGGGSFTLTGAGGTGSTASTGNGQTTTGNSGQTGGGNFF
jgi:outer membrane protein TolC|tara:strand:- start:2198 stop:3943 length:1746 start_codon:yes stop_codon:yes gene_type:complete